MKYAAALTLTFLCATVIAVAQYYPEGDTPPPGAWHYRSIPCTDTTVRLVGPRLSANGRTFTQADFQSGVIVVFNTHLGMGPVFANEYASVVHYQDTPGNNVMMAEKAGQVVEVCFLGPPEPSAMCNPDRDDRGRMYRVYDYRQKAQYWGTNEEHDCGGA